MQRENAKLVIDVGSPIRFGLFSLSLFLPTRIDSSRMEYRENKDLMFVRESVSL